MRDWHLFWHTAHFGYVYVFGYLDLVFLHLACFCYSCFVWFIGHFGKGITPKPYFVKSTKYKTCLSLYHWLDRRTSVSCLWHTLTKPFWYGYICGTSHSLKTDHSPMEP